jgi:signal transduction histidine kinase
MKALTGLHPKPIPTGSHNRVPLQTSDTRTRNTPAPRRTALIDAQGKIVAVNEDWALFAEETGADLSSVGPGVNYLDVCRAASSTSTFAREALRGTDAVLKGRLSSFVMDYPLETPLGTAYFRMDVSQITYGEARAAIAHTDITDLHVSREDDFKRLQQFGQRLIHAQEDERRRISREIHDDLGNKIALMALWVRQTLKRHPDKTDPTFHELSNILSGIIDLSTGLRNLSHNLHPPHLSYVGIGAALKSLCQEFKAKHEIQLHVSVPADPLPVSDDVELCIFRISQECLQNVAKHSHADKVSVVLERKVKDLRLTVSDSGRGFNPTTARQKGGLGLQSMEERALGIGGCLTVESSASAGTTVRLTIPIR